MSSPASRSQSFFEAIMPNDQNSSWFCCFYRFPLYFGQFRKSVVLRLQYGVPGSHPGNSPTLPLPLFR
jgi:hypothetical protein